MEPIIPQPTNEQSTISVSPISSQTKNKNRLVLILALLVFLLSVITAFFVWQNMQLRQQLATPQPTPTVSVTPTPTTDPTADWTTHKSKVLGIEFKLPSKLGLLEKSGKEVVGEKGTQYCMIYEGQLSFSIVGTVYAGGGPCGGGIFNIGTVSKDYEAGRMGGFGDLTGYVFQNDSYYFVRSLNNVSTSPLSKDLVVEKENPYGVKYLRIVGKNELQDWGGEKIDFPVAGTPGEGYLGALINIDANKYAGFGISMKVKTAEEEKLFDQILSTFRFTE